MTVKAIKDWEHIFLDTSVIINLLASQKKDIKDDRILFNSRLVKYLNGNNAGSGNPRKFYISSITISEILSIAPSSDRTVEIIKALDSENVTFVSFDNSIAELMNEKYHTLRTKDKLNAFAKSISWPDHDLVMAREWILKDAMILASSEYLECDVALTSDHKTMYKLAKNLAVPCGLINPKYFQVTDQHIMGYDHAKALSES